VSSLLEIHASLPYSVIAPYIGLEPFDIYTASGTCPYCGENAWTIHQDNKYLEESHYCFECKKAGTVFSLAAERLKMSQTEAVRYLYSKIECKMPDTVFEDFKRVTERQARINKIWHTAQQEMIKPTVQGTELLNRYGLRPDRMSRERFMAGPGALYGTISDREIRNLFNEPQFKTRDRSLLVVPCYRNPVDIGYVTLTTQDEEIAPGMKLCMSNIAFSGLQLMHRFQSPFVVVTSMMLNYLQLQNLNFLTSDVPLPMFGWKRPPRSFCKRQWSIAEGRLPIFWEKYPTPLILHQAMMLDAKLSFVGPESLRQQNVQVTPSNWHSWLRHDPPLDIVRRIADNAKPYEKALSDWLKTTSFDKKAQLLSDCDNYNESVSQLVRKHIDPKVKAGFSRRVKVPTDISSGKIFNFGHVVVVERDGKWFNLEGVIRFPGVLRVSHIVVRPDNKHEYIGKFIIKGHEIPFRVEEKKGTLRYFVELALANEIPVFLSHEANTWGKKSMEKFDPLFVACKFEEPSVVKGLDRIGWDPEGFQFFNAKLVKSVFRDTPKYAFPEDAPGPRQSYCKMTEDVKEALQKTGPEMEIMWALAIAMCAQITAQVGKKTPYGISLTRDEYDAFLHQLFVRFDLKEGPLTGWKHHWPRKLEKLSTAVRKCADNYFIAFNDKPNAIEVVEVDVTDEDLEPRLLSHSADKIAMNYLKHFTQLEIPKGIRMYKGWLDFTRKNLGEVFDFVPAEMLDKAYARLKVNT
jgi:hypothetical protein